jgi:hypothetical protein
MDLRDINDVKLLRVRFTASGDKLKFSIVKDNGYEYVQKVIVPIDEVKRAVTYLGLRPIFDNEDAIKVNKDKSL